MKKKKRDSSTQTQQSPCACGDSACDCAERLAHGHGLFFTTTDAATGTGRVFWFWCSALLAVVLAVGIATVCLPGGVSDAVGRVWPTIDHGHGHVPITPAAFEPTDKNANSRLGQAELGEGEAEDEEMMAMLGDDNKWEAESLILLEQYDNDQDGHLSPKELEPLTQTLREANIDPTYDVPIRESEEVVSLKSYFEPLNLNTLTMNKDKKSRQRHHREFQGLKSWKTAAKDWQNFATNDFAAFLPPNSSLLESLGTPYYIVEPVEELVSGATLPIERYKPLKLAKSGAITVHRLLAMFHPHVFVYTRFAPQGSVACMKAYNKDYVEIVFRIHAEFQLNEEPMPPFWFSPAQFTGRIILDRNASKLRHFHLYVPNDKLLNVDMEWLSEPNSEGSHMEVDIGYMGRMELHSTHPSKLVAAPDAFIEPNQTLVEPVWSQQITREEAARSLEVKMYPFKAVRYHNLTNAFALANAASERTRLVHSVVLWGALDDQSC